MKWFTVYITLANDVLGDFHYIQACSFARSKGEAINDVYRNMVAFWPEGWYVQSCVVEDY